VFRHEFARVPDVLGQKLNRLGDIFVEKILIEASLATNQARRAVVVCGERITELLAAESDGVGGLFGHFGLIILWLHFIKSWL